MGSRQKSQSVKIGNPVPHSPVFLANLFILSEYIFLASCELAPDTVILFPRFVIEHINVQISHKALRASVVQSAFSSLSHVVNTSPSLTFPVIPSVNMGENAYPSLMYAT